MTSVSKETEVISFTQFWFPKGELHSLYSDSITSILPPLQLFFIAFYLYSLISVPHTLPWSLLHIVRDATIDHNKALLLQY